LLLGLHDVTPVHLPRLRRAEALFEELGVSQVSYLFIPDFHRESPGAECSAFADFCQRRPSFCREWLLHGLYHVDDPELSLQATRAGTRLWQRFQRRYLTGGEAEFLPLDRAALERRIEQGTRIFRDCLDQIPEGFVAPAWLYNQHLIPALKKLGFRFTENHLRIIDLQRDVSLRAPVVTWATRNWWRKHASIAAAWLRSGCWRRTAYVRVAVHPHDFDHPETIRSVILILRTLLEHCELNSYRQLLCPDGPS
jgi:predicted deacetylase